MSGPVEAPFGWRAAAEMTRHEGAAAVVLKAERRGTAVLDAVWLRWPGPLGLAWKQRRLGLARAVLITPDIRPVREASAQLVNRDAAHGIVAQLQVGEGAEFEALTDYRQGMDRRSIDFGRFPPEHGDDPAVPFSFCTDSIDRPQIDCHILHTSAETHEIVRANITRSPLYNGQIAGMPMWS